MNPEAEALQIATVESFNLFTNQFFSTTSDIDTFTRLHSFLSFRRCPTTTRTIIQRKTKIRTSETKRVAAAAGTNHPNWMGVRALLLGREVHSAEQHKPVKGFVKVHAITAAS